MDYGAGSDIARLIAENLRVQEARRQANIQARQQANIQALRQAQAQRQAQQPQPRPPPRPQPQPQPQRQIFRQRTQRPLGTMFRPTPEGSLRPTTQMEAMDEDDIDNSGEVRNPLPVRAKTRMKDKASIRVRHKRFPYSYESDTDLDREDSEVEGGSLINTFLPNHQHRVSNISNLILR